MERLLAGAPNGIEGGDLRRSTPMVKLLKLDLLQVKGNSIAAVNMAVD